MYIYNCPIIGEGSAEDPFHPDLTSIIDVDKWEVYGEIPWEIKQGDIVKIKVTHGDRSI